MSMKEKELKVQTEKINSTEVDFCEEMSRLNNELANMQRELAKKNAALEKANTEKTKLINDLQTALEDVNTLRGHNTYLCFL